MAAITANAEIIKRVPSDLNLYAVAASTHIYKGSLVGLHPFTLYAKPFQPGDIFVGVAYEEIDNSVGTATAGYLSVRVYDQGEFICGLSSVAVADLGKEAYALDSSGTVGKVGHYDGFMGYIVGVYATNWAIVRLKAFGQKPAAGGTGSFLVETDFMDFMPFADESSAIATLPKPIQSGLAMVGIGAGLTAGTTGFLQTHGSTGLLKMLLDNDNEAQSLALLTQMCFDVANGITMRCRATVTTAPAAAARLNIGLFSLSGGITATELADWNATTAGVKRVGFETDIVATGLDLYADYDNNTTATSTDTTVNISAAATYDEWGVIARVGGACELWHKKATAAWAQALSTASIWMGTTATNGTGVFQGVFLLEKGAVTDVPAVTIDNLRVAGGHA